MEDGVKNLLAERAIVNRINTLFIATDNRDWAMVMKCFAPEVLFDMTSLVGGGPVTLNPRQIVDDWEKGLKELQTVHHQAGNILIEIEGDRAQAFCYGIAYHYLPNPSNRNTRMFVGSYDLGLVEDAEVWRINWFKFNLKFIDGNPELK